MCNEILPNLGCRYLVTSLSHIACNNIKAKGVNNVKTLASLFNTEFKSLRVIFDAIAQEYECIVVDEMSMVTYEYYTC